MKNCVDYDSICMLSRKFIYAKKISERIYKKLNLSSQVRRDSEVWGGGSLSSMIYYLTFVLSRNIYNIQRFIENIIKKINSPNIKGVFASNVFSPLIYIVLMRQLKGGSSFLTLFGPNFQRYQHPEVGVIFPMQFL